MSVSVPDRFDLIVLNPPFSFKRTQCVRARGKFAKEHCSVAFAFLFYSPELLERSGRALGGDADVDAEKR